MTKGTGTRTEKETEKVKEKGKGKNKKKNRKNKRKRNRNTQGRSVETEIKTEKDTEKEDEKGPEIETGIGNEIRTGKRSVEFDIVCHIFSGNESLSVFVTHPYDCSHYYHCVGLTPILMTCPEGFYKNICCVFFFKKFSEIFF